MSKPLAKIMNQSIETGIFPSKLKQAKITPIYKTGDELECGNYRPISLLSNINRLFEKLMFLQSQSLYYDARYIMLITVWISSKSLH